MKYLVILKVALLLAPVSRASELELKAVFLPLYANNAIVNEGEEPLHAKPRAINFLSRGAEPEATLAILKAPFVPHHDETWRDSGDANVISTCRLILTHAAKELEGGGFLLEVTVDASSLVRPEGFKLSDAEAVDLVRQAISLNFPKAAIVIKKGGQSDAGQPAAAHASKREGKEKSKPETEVPPR